MHLMQSVMHGKHCIHLWLHFPQFLACLPSSAFGHNKVELRMTNNYRDLGVMELNLWKIITDMDSYRERPGEWEQGHNGSVRPPQFAQSSLAVCVCDLVEDTIAIYRAVPQT